MARLEPTVLDDFVRGDQPRWTIQLLDAADQPLNCTGATARFTVRDGYPDPEIDDDAAALLALTTLTPLLGLEWVNQAVGQLLLILPAAFTKTLEELCYLFDLQVTTAAGAPITVAVGTIEPDYRDITRAV